MLRSFRSLIGRKSRRRTYGAEDAIPDLPRPQHATYVVGDIHGRSDLLELMLELIDAHIGGTGSVDPHLVFVGNYINRGSDSAAVLTRLRELTDAMPQNVACIMGNHERMLVDFLADPILRGPRFLREGGAETLASYRVSSEHLLVDPSAGDWAATGLKLFNALGTDTRTWLQDLPLTWSSGNLWVVHAGADPQRSMEDQTSRVLLWGHPEFGNSPRGDDLWVAHGHVETERPYVREGCISTNTAAWRTGRLTACAIRPDGRYDFLQT